MVGILEKGRMNKMIKLVIGIIELIRSWTLNEWNVICTVLLVVSAIGFFLGLKYHEKEWDGVDWVIVLLKVSLICLILGCVILVFGVGDFYYSMNNGGG